MGDFAKEFEFKSDLSFIKKDNSVYLSPGVYTSDTLIVPRIYDFMHSSRFEAIFPPEFNIPPYLVRSVDNIAYTVYVGDMTPVWEPIRVVIALTLGNEGIVERLRGLLGSRDPFDMHINNFNADGAIVNTFHINNAYITSIDIGQLSYDVDDILSLTLTIRFDNMAIAF